MIYFKRKLYDKMLKWKTERNGATALLIQGARRIGKSTLVQKFAETEYKTYILVDFSVCTREIFNLFEDISNLNFIFMKLQLHYNVKLIERQSVIIFDEVQKQPLARQAIKHLVKDGRYDYIETGSLLSVHKSSVDILIPSEETRIDMFPMDYEEFRWALGDTATVPLLKEVFDKKIPLGNGTHRKLMRDFRLYMLVGGMPQAVAELIKTNNLSAVDMMKRDILSLYQEDLKKIDDSGLAATLFKLIPSQLSRNGARFMAPTGNTDATNLIVKELEDSMTVNVAYHANDPNVALALTKNIERFKMYTADTGLFVTLAFMDKNFTDNIIYEKLLADKLSANLGYLYENVVAQMLRATGKQLYYHIIPYADGKKYYETDLLIADMHKVSPIEVKSSGYHTHASLDAFRGKFSARIANSYVIYTKDYHCDGNVTFLPVYMTMFI
ncbi:MAG: ATP-binding protein [Bacteroidales bacterium]|nr:ATP-binding protein [Bacteroidales bacterium]